MKVVVIGATGRIGELLARNLRQEDLRVFDAQRSSGVDILTGAGLARALQDAEIVVDVSNASPPETALHFFATAGRTLFAAERAAGVRHHVALSIVGLDRLVAGDYFRAKKIQEDLVRAAGIPFTIVRSTQFFEFIADAVQDGTASTIPISPAQVQPIAGEDVADSLADAVFSVPINGSMEIAGPEQFSLADIATEIATAHEDGRQVVADIRAPYFGVEVGERSLLPDSGARILPLRFDDWLRESLQPQPISIPTS